MARLERKVSEIFSPFWTKVWGRWTRVKEAFKDATTIAHQEAENRELHQQLAGAKAALEKLKDAEAQLRVLQGAALTPTARDLSQRKISVLGTVLEQVGTLYEEKRYAEAARLLQSALDLIRVREHGYNYAMSSASLFQPRTRLVIPRTSNQPEPPPPTIKNALTFDDDPPTKPQVQQRRG